MSRNPEFSYPEIFPDESLAPRPLYLENPIPQDFRERNRSNKKTKPDFQPMSHNRSASYIVDWRAAHHYERYEDHTAAADNTFLDHIRQAHENHNSDAGNAYEIFDKVPPKLHAEAILREKINKGPRTILAGHEYYIPHRAEEDD